MKYASHDFEFLRHCITPLCLRINYYVKFTAAAILLCTKMRIKQHFCAPIIIMLLFPVLCMSYLVLKLYMQEFRALKVKTYLAVISKMKMVLIGAGLQEIIIRT